MRGLVEPEIGFNVVDLLGRNGSRRICPMFRACGPNAGDHLLDGTARHHLDKGKANNGNPKQCRNHQEKPSEYVISHYSR